MYMYIHDYTISNGNGPNILMSRYIDHKKKFPGTHRHFRPAIKILAAINKQTLVLAAYDFLTNFIVVE